VFFFFFKVSYTNQHECYKKKKKRKEKKKGTIRDQTHWIFLCYLFIFVLDLAGYFSFSQTNLLYFYLKKGYWRNLKYKNPTGRTDMGFQLKMCVSTPCCTHDYTHNKGTNIQRFITWVQPYKKLQAVF